MKIKKIKNYKTKLLQLQLLKLYYRKKSYNFRTSLKRLELYLSKISDIVYRYHIANKKILFLGFPKNFKKTLKKTKHIVIPEYFWSNGMLSNRNQKMTKSHDLISTNNQNNLTNKTAKLLFKLRKKIDLVIVYNLNDKSTAIKESYFARIPVIAFANKLNILDIEETYVSEGLHNFVSEKTSNNNFFFSMTEATLKRALKVKKTVKTKKNTINIPVKKRSFWKNKNPNK